MVFKDIKDIKNLENLQRVLDSEEVQFINKLDLLLLNRVNMLMLVEKKRKESKDKFGLKDYLLY
jgi:hypothetical protein